MSGYIESGQQVTVTPLTTAQDFKDLKPGDIVLCSVRGQQYLHLVGGIRRQGETSISLQIQNARGYVNGWTPAHKVYGKCVKVEP